MIDWIVGLDQKIALFMDENVTNIVLLHIFNFFSIIGIAALIWIAIFIIISIKRKEKTVWLSWIIVFFAVCIISELVFKNIFARNRPYVDLLGLDMFVHKLSSYSFPSGHTSFSAASVVLVLRLKPNPHVSVYIILAVLISVSRVILKAHYFSDVICGYIIGTIIAVFTLKIMDAVIKRKQIKLNIKEKKKFGHR